MLRFGAGWKRARGKHVRAMRAGVQMTALALLVPLALPVTGAADMQARLPSAASVRSAAIDLVDFVTGHHPPAPKTPVQQSGSAAGKAHSVPAAVTRAVANARGRAPGKGRGQRPAYHPHGPSARRFTTGPAHGVFNARTSKVVASGTTARSVLYKNADGSYTRRVYSQPVNYKTPSGSWAPIDSALVKGAGGRWREKANSAAASFAASGADAALGTLATGGGAESVSFSLAGAGPAKGKADGASVTYASILPSTDLTETATATGIGEALTLRSARAGTSWVFPLRLTGLTASLRGDSVVLRNSAGKAVWVIPSAVARSGPRASSALAYHLVSYDGGPALEMTLARSWLDARGRVFPVVVDPTIFPGADGSTYVESDGGTPQTENNGGSEFLESGTATFSGETDQAISFVDFSAVLDGQVPGAHVTSASLNMFENWAVQCSAPVTVNAYQVTQPWSPSQSLTYPGPSHAAAADATWTGTPPADACVNDGSQPGLGAYVSLNFNSAGLALLNDWVTGSGSADDGLAVAASQTDDTQGVQFDSANDVDVTASEGGDCTGNCEPYLQVDYTPNTPPQINAQYPPDNSNPGTLTPELIASGTDPDGGPGPLRYDFTVYNPAGTQVADSGLVSAGDWTVPPGDLSWGQTYYWTVRDYDGADSSSTATTSYFSTTVPQQQVTSQMSQDQSGAGFDAGSGNYTTSATDAKIATVGPALEITRDYNSQNPSASEAFGAGWSSLLDMKVTPGQDGSGGTADTEVVTNQDGTDSSFGLTSSGTYAPPSGQYATLAAVSGGGFTLTDKSDTVYKFTQPLGSGAYGITSIADDSGNTETFTWTTASPFEITKITSASGRALTVNWTNISGALYPHVTSVVTGDATPGDSTTAETWGYGYSGDELTKACPPTSTTACTAYSYTSGSNYPQDVLNSAPHSYWRLDETSGTTAASSVTQNEGADNATYSGVTLGADTGPLPGATAASFNGTSSHVTLPVNLVSGAIYQSISLWFKTTSDNGVLFSYQDDPIGNGTTSAQYTPSLYVGSDGKLHGEFWTGAVQPMSTSSAVTDGKWHLVTMTAAGTTQSLYLDGVNVGTIANTAIVPIPGMNDYLGAGFLGGQWPDEAHQGSSGTATYFTGDISDAASWDRSLTGAEVAGMYAAGAHPSGLLTKVAWPSGKIYAQISYSPLTGRVTQVIDQYGGTWQIAAPSVSGSSRVYAESVLGGHPRDYWRLADSGTANAVNQVNGGTAVYSNVTQGVTGGPFSDATVDSFNGSSSYLQLPQGLDGAGSQSFSLWFKTSTAGGVLVSSSADPVTAGTTSGGYTPMLYIGSDGFLLGKFWDGSTATGLESAAPVDDSKWHNVVMTAGGGSQAMYVDGALADSIGGSTVTGGQASGQNNLYAGAGFLGGGWPDEPFSGSGTGHAAHFQGDLSDLAFYGSQLSAGQVTVQWNASKFSTGLTPVQTGTATDPGGHTPSWTYDQLNNDRMLSQTDARGGQTTYGYDVGGFQDETVDPNGNYALTGYDVRGNVVSTTSCQNQAAGKCSTTFNTYFPDDTSAALTPDPRNDKQLTTRDPRSASATDTTYETSDTYNTAGEMTAETTPPVTGSPSGQTTTYLYTDGSTTAGGYNGAVPPKGLPYKETTPGGAVTTTLYYADGDIAQVTNPDGLRTVYVYDGLGRMTSATEYSDSYPNGLTTSSVYDKDGRVVTKTAPPVTNRVTGAIHTAQTTTVYDVDGNATSQTVADITGGDASRTELSSYNAHNELASRTDADGNVTQYTYDTRGNKASQTDPDGNVTEYTYDGNSNPLTTTLENYTGSPSGSQPPANLVEESRAYDPAGRLASVTDAVGRVTKYGYTDDGMTATVTGVSPDGTQSFTEESDTYDAAGNLVQQVTNNGATTTDFTVDAADREKQNVLDPAGLDRTTTITYTPDGKESSVAQSGPQGATQTTSYTYDPMGNKTSQTLTDPGAGGPAAYFPLSQSSGTHVPDSISGGQAATASGVTWDGSEATFGGAEGQGIATNGPVADTTGSYTVAAWVNITGDTSSDQVLVSQSAGTDAGFYLKYDPGTRDWEFAAPSTDTNDPSGASVESSSPAAINTWTFLVGTYDVNTGTLTLYVNGTPVGTAANPSPIASDGPLLIGAGRFDGTNGSWLDGQIADVGIYPRALSGSEVSTLASLDDGYITPGTLTTSWKLDQRGLPTSMTDPDGNVTGYTYDEAGKLAVTTQPPVVTQTYGHSLVSARPVSTTGYDTFGDKAETQDPNGNVTTYGYDADGLQVSQTLPPYTPPGSSADITAPSTMKYDSMGRLSSRTDPLGNKTTYSYDQLSDLTSQTAPNQGVTSSAYDADKELLSQTSPTGAQTLQTYDFMGRKATSTQVERFGVGSSPQSYTTNYTYDAGGFLSKTLTPDGTATLQGHNANGELTSTTDGAGNVTSYFYDDFGRQQALEYPDGTAKVTSYDAAGNVTEVQNENASGTALTTTTSAYDGDGNKLSSTDARGNSTTYTYSPTGAVTSEVQPVSSTSAVVTSFGYDAAGNQTRYTDGDGNNWYSTYNAWELPESRVEPSTSRYTSPADSTFTMAYDADQRVAAETAPGGVTVTNGYNNVGDLTSQSGTGADAATATRTFGYDPSGNLTSAATSDTAPSSGPSNATSESFTYNDRGQVLTSSGTAGSTQYTFNGDDLETSIADAAGTTSYTYDNADRLKTLSDPATGSTATYSYNNDSLVSGISYGSDVQSLGYDALHRLTSDTLKTSSGSAVAAISYGYNADSDLTSMNTTNLAGPSSNTYTYDEADRLTSWNNGSTTTDYGYDASGNLTQDGPKTYTYDARDELTSDGTNSYAYTANGTLASETTPTGTVNSTFDAYGDQVTSGSFAYNYDANGRLVSSVYDSAGDGFQFAYAGSTGTVASDGTNTYTWDPSGSSLEGIGVPGGGTSGGVLALTDTHGDMIGQFTASGTALAGSVGFDPWGNVTDATGAPLGQVGFQSSWTGPATGNNIMGARWYNPADGDFTSQDTVQVNPVPDPAAANPFAYAADDPLDRTDPTGHTSSGICPQITPVIGTAGIASLVGSALGTCPASPPASTPVNPPASTSPSTSLPACAFVNVGGCNSGSNLLLAPPRPTGTGTRPVQDDAAWWKLITAAALAALLGSFANQLGRDEEEQSCVTTPVDVKMTPNYFDLDRSGGASRGRAAGVTACLGTDNLLTNRAGHVLSGRIIRPTMANIPGVQTGMHSTHLLGLEIGGNSEAENLVPMWAKANIGWAEGQMRDIEKRHVEAIIKKDQRVFFTAIPSYVGTPNPYVPLGIMITWHSLIDTGDCFVPNTNNPANVGGGCVT